ncbi:Leucine-rich_repeat-containing protein [Hexamita inflata]|uniref:Leucine-rich repeat-containing protein n=1 Tax=Hexamita inflata TaxID=28002 RepID=A0AA86Q2S9_9EUKA|nr:Leucine-rich repeat-containing protein [Hexamita inflata]
MKNKVWAQTIIKNAWRNYKIWKLKVIIVAAKIKMSNAALVIINIMKKYNHERRKLSNLCKINSSQVQQPKLQKGLRRNMSSFLMAQTQETSDFKLEILIAKDMSTEETAKILIQNLIQQLNQEICLRLLQSGVSVKPITQATVSFKQTNIQFITRTESNIIVAQRNYKTYRQATEQMWLEMDKQFVKVNSKLRKYLKQSTDQLPGSIRHQIWANLGQMELPNQTVKSHHILAEHSLNPFFIMCTINHKEIAASIYYFIMRSIKYSDKTQDKYSIYNYNNEMFEYGQQLITRQCTAKFVQTVDQIFESGLIPMMMQSSTCGSGFAHIKSVQGVEKEMAALLIQKQFRAKRKIIQFITQFNERNRTAAKSFTQIIALNRASRLIQRQIRAFIGRKQYLIQERLRDAYQSGFEHQFFFMTKQNLQLLQMGSLQQQSWVKINISVSPPCSQQFVDNIFGSNDQDTQAQLTHIQKQQKILNQFITIQKPYENIFSSITGTIFGYPHSKNYGVAQVNSDLLKYKELSSKQLYQYVKYLPDVKPIHITGLEFTTKFVGDSVDSAHVDPLKVMWGQTSNDSFFSQKLLEKFKADVIFRENSQKNLEQNLLADISISDLDLTIFPPTFRSVASYMFKDLKIIRKRSATVVNDPTIAIKALVLELKYSDPQMIPYSDIKYSARKSMFLTSPSVTLSFNSVLQLVGAINIQRIFKMILVRRMVKKSVQKTSLMKKIGIIQNQGLQRTDYVKDTKRELSVMSFLSRNKSPPFKQPPPQSTSIPLRISTPVLKPKNTKSQKQLENLNSRIQRSVSTAARYEQYMNQISENRIKVAAVKEQLNPPRDLNKCVHLVQKVQKMTVQYKSDQFKNELKTKLLQNTDIFVPKQLFMNNNQMNEKQMNENKILNEVNELDLHVRDVGDEEGYDNLSVQRPMKSRPNTAKLMNSIDENSVQKEKRPSTGQSINSQNTIPGTRITSAISPQRKLEIEVLSRKADIMKGKQRIASAKTELTQTNKKLATKNKSELEEKIMKKDVQKEIQTIEKQKTVKIIKEKQTEIQKQKIVAQKTVQSVKSAIKDDL